MNCGQCREGPSTYTSTIIYNQWSCSLTAPLQTTDRLLRHSDKGWEWMTSIGLSKMCHDTDQVWPHSTNPEDA